MHADCNKSISVRFMQSKFTKTTSKIFSNRGARPVRLWSSKVTSYSSAFFLSAQNQTDFWVKIFQNSCHVYHILLYIYISSPANMNYFIIDFLYMMLQFEFWWHADYTLFQEKCTLKMWSLLTFSRVSDCLQFIHESRVIRNVNTSKIMLLDFYFWFSCVYMYVQWH